MKMCCIYDADATIWVPVDIGMEVIIVTLWLYIVQHGVTLLMQMCRIYENNAVIWVPINVAMEVIIATKWLYIGQHDDATHDGLVVSHVTSPQHVKFM